MCMDKLFFDKYIITNKTCKFGFHKFNHLLRKKGTKAVTGAVAFQKGTLLYLKVAYWYLSCTF